MKFYIYSCQSSSVLSIHRIAYCLFFFIISSSLIRAQSCETQSIYRSEGITEVMIRYIDYHEEGEPTVDTLIQYLNDKGQYSKEVYNRNYIKQYFYDNDHFLTRKRYISYSDTGVSIYQHFYSYLDDKLVLLDYQIEDGDIQTSFINLYDERNQLSETIHVGSCSKQTDKYEYTDEGLLKKKRVIYGIEGASFLNYRIKYDYDDHSRIKKETIKTGQINKKVVIHYQYDEQGRKIRRSFKFKPVRELGLHCSHVKRNAQVEQFTDYNDLSLIRAVQEYHDDLLVHKKEYTYR